MTKREGEVLAVRLARIWVPGRELRNQMEWRDSLQSAEWDIVGPQFQFWAYIRSDVTFLCIDPTNDDPGVPRQRQFALDRHQGENTIKNTTGHLEYYTNPERLIQWGDYENADKHELYVQFGAQWMDFFRRGCWLSGCAIEATSHEKAQWTQGFSQQELDAWNLKM